MSLPFVSCICPTFNRVPQLEEALECFLRQDYRGPKEFIVLNDCPAQKLSFSHPEVRVLNYATQYSSLSEKHGDMVKLAAGDCITVWDDDDIKLPTALSFCVKMLLQNGCSLFYPDKVLISYENRVYRQLHRSSFHLNGIWTRRLYDSVGGYHMNTEHPDGFLQAKFLEKVTDFREYPIDTADNYTILRVNSGVPQISFSHNEDDSSTDISRSYRDSILAAAASHGGYELRPHWDLDYVEAARTAISAGFTGPVYSATYDRRAGGKVTVHAAACRVKAEFINTDNGELLHTATVDSGDDINNIWVKPPPRAYHVDYRIKIYGNDVLAITLEPTLRGRTVLIRVDTKALGDTLAWFPYVLEFQKKHGCKVIVSTFNNQLLQNWQSDDVKIIEPVDVKDYDVEYKLGVFSDHSRDPFNFREKPLQKVAADILGLTYREQHLDLRHLAGPRPIAEKYVVIGTTSTMGCKEWQCPGSWQQVVDYLHARDYQVVCIPAVRRGYPGRPDQPLLDGVLTAPEDLQAGAITYLGHCEFFIGLSSALSWVARCLDKETVMISGFTDTYNEFVSKCHRVINKQVCNSCYNDVSLEFGRHWAWCPRNKDFECSREITADTVITAVNGVRARIAKSDYALCTKDRERIICILPHCSSGGLPQHFLEKLKVLRERYDVYVVEWAFHGTAFSTQRNKIRRLCTEFIEMDNSRHEDIYDIISSINPDAIHFEELPNMYSGSQVFNRLHDSHSYRIFHTSHCAHKQFIRNVPDKFIFPSAAQIAMYGAGEVIEHPIFDRFYTGASSPKDVLSIGIISEHKNQKRLVEISKKLPDVTFHFCGAFAGNFRNYWSTIPPQANCVFHGELDEPAIEELYKKCSVLVHTSVLELLPLVFAESLSYGLPVLANWLPIYEYASFKDHIHKLSLDTDEAVGQIRTLLETPRVRVEPSYNDFKNKIRDSFIKI